MSSQAALYVPIAPTAPKTGMCPQDACQVTEAICLGWETSSSLIMQLQPARHEFNNVFIIEQVWVPVMSWYVDNRKQLADTIKKYSDPPSEHLLPDLPLHAR